MIIKNGGSISLQGAGIFVKIGIPSADRNQDRQLRTRNTGWTSISLREFCFKTFIYLTGNIVEKALHLSASKIQAQCAAL
jgi:hypothetical protein